VKDLYKQYYLDAVLQGLELDMQYKTQKLTSKEETYLLKSA